MLPTFLGGLLLLMLSCSAGSRAGCDSGTAPEREELQGKWKLESVNGETVEADIWFEVDGARIQGFDGCNTFGGSLDAPDRMRITQRACADDVPRMPLPVLELCARLESAELEDETLEITLPEEAGTATFRRDPDP